MHNKIDCDGKWIDISTFTEPGKQICDTCRAVRRVPVNNDLDLSSHESYGAMRESDLEPGAGLSRRAMIAWWIVSLAMGWGVLYLVWRGVASIWRAL